MSRKRDVGAKIRAAREACGLSQQALADAVGAKSHQNVYNYERGDREPSFEVLERIATATGRPLSWFFQEDASTEPATPPPTAPAPPAPSAADAPPPTDLAAIIAQAVAQAVGQAVAQAQAQVVQSQAQVADAVLQMAQTQAQMLERQAQMMQAQAQLADALAKHATESARRFDHFDGQCADVRERLARVEDGLHEVVEAVEDLAENERGILKQRVDRLEEESHQERAEGGTVLGAA